MALNAQSAGYLPSGLYSSLTAAEPMMPPAQSPTLRFPVGKNHTVALSAGFAGSTASMPPLPLMYCFSTGTSSSPFRVGTAVPLRSEPMK